MRESLQLQHNTNLNIQRSQSTQRFNNTANSALLTSSVTDTNRETEEVIPPCEIVDSMDQTNASEEVNAHTDNDENNMAIQQQQQQQLQQSNNQTFEWSDEATEQTSSLADEVIRMLAGTNLDFVDDSLGVGSVSIGDLHFSDFESIPNIEIKDCEYLKLVCTFKTTLVLPDIFFQSNFPPLCFCHHCLGSCSYPQISSKLSGWTFFKLNREAVNQNSSVQQIDFSTSGEWIPLYYMTTVDKIRSILDQGQPLPEGGFNGGDTSGKDEPGNHLMLHLYPPEELHNVQHKYTYNNYTINTAFEVYVRKQALCSAPSRPPSTIEPSPVEQPSTSANTDQAEGGARQVTWFTKEAGACVLTALLLNLDAINPKTCTGN